jgi:hypothetical protein
LIKQLKPEKSPVVNLKEEAKVPTNASPLRSNHVSRTVASAIPRFHQDKPGALPKANVDSSKRAQPASLLKHVVNQYAFYLFKLKEYEMQYFCYF